MESAVNWAQIEGNRKQIKGKAKEQWRELPDDPLDVIVGKRKQLAGKKFRSRKAIARNAWKRSPIAGSDFP